jgi:urea carboxylase-associated protein 2
MTGGIMSETTGAPPGPVLWEDTIAAGCHWSGVVRRGVSLRLTDLEGGANCSALLYNFEEKTERYNMPDTLKAQHTAFLTQGHVCYSDMGRVLCSITRDTAGWNDTLCGLSHDDQLREQYGDKRFQEHRNAMHRSAQEGLLKEIARWGLGLRDVHASINFFSKVTAAADGGLTYHSKHSKAGDFVDLRFEMHALVALSASVHALDRRPANSPAPVKLTAWRSGVAGAEDACRNRCPENQRGFINTERYFAQ